MNLPVEVTSNLADDLGLAHTGGTPDVDGHTFADQRVKRLIEFRGFHVEFLSGTEGMG